MFRRSNGATLGCVLAVLSIVAPVHADDYLIYSRFIPPGLSSDFVVGVGGYVEDLGVPETWGDEIQYVYFLCETTGYKYRVWVTNHGGPDDPTPTYIEIRQHPDHPDPRFVGPIEPRHFEYVSHADLYGYASGGHTQEFHVDATGVYLGAFLNPESSCGIHKWDHDWAYVGQISQPPPVRTESLAYDPAEKVWYAGGKLRTIYQLRDTNGDGRFMDESWQAIFSYPTYAGGHHDGMEYVGGALWISDMCADVLGKWTCDAATGTWYEAGRFFYSDSADVEGMGYGPYDHFWIGSGYGGPAHFYELGDVNTLPCVLAEAGEDVDSWPANVPLAFDASGSHPTRPGTQIALYEWDFDGDGVYDYRGADPVAMHAYPVDGVDPNDPNCVDCSVASTCYTATLRVTVHDPNGLCDANETTDVDTRKVCVTPPPWCPVADPGRYYSARVGTQISLDGSGSFHPAARAGTPEHSWHDDIALWEWDLDNDGDFDDATGVTVSTSWSEPNTYIVSLRVTDEAGRSDEKRTTVTVGPVHDVAVESLALPDDAEIRAGDVISVTAVVSNLGDYPESSNVTVACDGETVDIVRVVALAAGAGTEVASSWDTTGLAAGQHRLKLYAGVVPGEIDISNNCLETTVDIVGTSSVGTDVGTALGQ